MTREIFEVEAPYKFTFPVEKAESRSDGKYLVGLASGPEVDSQNERVHPSLIAKWADQINSGQIEVVYRDWHQKDSSLEDLGVVTKAWVDENDHLGVEVKLDEDHPTAMYIHKKAMAGKKYGMSVFGKVISFADEFEKALGRTVRTFYDATLDEVSNTTRPVWTPSFGSVLSKAVTEAANGDNRLSDAAKVETVQSETVTTETTDSGAATAPDTGKAPEAEEVVVDTTPEPTPQVDTTVVEKAIKTETKRDDKALSDIVKTFNALGQKLQAAGLLTEEDASVDDTATTVEKSETTVTEETTSAPEVATLSKAVSDLTDIVRALAERTPDGSNPGVLVKAAAADPLAELNAVVDPIERMRLAMAIAHGSDAQR